MLLSDMLFPAVSLGGLGVTFGILLGYAAKKFAVKVDERVAKVRECLPGANCGGCGYAGCDAYAQAVVDGTAPAHACTAGGNAAASKIGEVLGVAVDALEQRVAYVKCGGTCSAAKDKYKYYGIMDCRQAASVPGGGAKACSAGCLGFGTCASVCQFDSIQIIDGIAHIDESTCTGCGACLQVCPKSVIEMVPASRLVTIACSSHEKGKGVKENCSAGCIGCSICAKNCPEGAITMVKDLPEINYDKCTQCGTCARKCPTKAIANGQFPIFDAQSLKVTS